MPLTDISEELLGLAPKTAVMRARADVLDLPTFRMGKGKAPFLVDISVLADFIEKTAKESKEEFLSTRA